MGILHSVGDVDPDDYRLASLLDANRPDGLRAKLRTAQRADGSRAFDPLIALALMVFFALCSQCMSTLATIRSETRTLRWPVFTFTYMTTLAWAAAVAVYQVGRALGHGGS
jgi:ferrous iron transport protein B